MKKIACLLLLFQGGIMMAQTETVPTINGKKIQVTPNGLGTADNGLTAAGGNVQLGGTLIQKTTLVTSSSATLALKGLQAGAAADNVLVLDANGVIKSIPRSSYGDNLGNHIAGKDLNMNGYNITAAKDITATGKVSAGTAAIAKGTNGSTPRAGSVLASFDGTGSVVWKDPEVNVVPKLVGFVTSSTSRSGTNIYFDTKEIDVDNAFSGGPTGVGSVYTVPKKGMYQFFLNISVTSPGSWYVRILKNDKAVAAVDATGSSSGPSASIFGIDECVVGDRITVDMGGGASGYKGGLTQLTVFRFE
ncbi:hypothetical protein [Flavobacterium gelatinilyticum]|uniref:hypothetical protein n=1 Tax=Flavobacterium gelatinilyticum TaxID=3003260 RepID=UPI002480A698|nr:hypothetical protein [Flavobacterium gelatinilyticum]